MLLAGGSGILDFSSSPTSWVRCLGQRSLASFPLCFHKGITGLGVRLILLEHQISSVHQWFSSATVCFLAA